MAPRKSSDDDRVDSGLESTKAIVLLVAVVILVMVIFYLLTNKNEIIELVSGINPNSVTGLVIYCIILFAVILTGVIPASAITILGGSVFGLWAGFGASASMLFAAAIVGFSITRGVGGQQLRQKIESRLPIQFLDQAMQKDGAKIIALLRFCPVAPFGITSYALGMTSVGIREYIVGTFASLPALFCFTLVGATARTSALAIVEGRADQQPWLMWFLVFATVVSIFAVAGLFRNDIKNLIKGTKPN